MLALHGIDAYGLEISQKAVDACDSYARSQLSRPDTFNFGSFGSQDMDHRGVVKFVVGDFFKSDWEKGCGGAAFDFIYDYTVGIVVLQDVTILTQSKVPLRHTPRDEAGLGTPHEAITCTKGSSGVFGVSTVQGSNRGRTALRFKWRVLGLAC